LSDYGAPAKLRWKRLIKFSTLLGLGTVLAWLLPTSTTTKNGQKPETTLVAPDLHSDTTSFDAIVKETVKLMADWTIEKCLGYLARRFWAAFYLWRTKGAKLDPNNRAALVQLEKILGKDGDWVATAPPDKLPDEEVLGTEEQLHLYAPNLPETTWEAKGEQILQHAKELLRPVLCGPHRPTGPALEIFEKWIVPGITEGVLKGAVSPTIRYCVAALAVAIGKEGLERFCDVREKGRRSPGSQPARPFSRPEPPADCRQSAGLFAFRLGVHR
jgi:hypothetical protein